MQRHNFDARRAPRHIAKVRVLYFSKGQARAVDAECQNISADGLFVKTHKRGPDAGTPVSLLLQFDGGGQGGVGAGDRPLAGGGPLARGWDRGSGDGDSVHRDGAPGA